jgi:hypothetical protein
MQAKYYINYNAEQDEISAIIQYSVCYEEPLFKKKIYHGMIF